MKLHFGSIQRKGNNLYLVSRCENKQKWIALKTSDPKLAQARALEILPPQADSISWMMHLIRLGECAHHHLYKQDMISCLTWENLWEQFLLRAQGTLTSASESSYERWMRILCNTAHELCLTSEDMMRKDSCEKIIRALCTKYISGKRMIVFYKRVWRSLEMDSDIWECDFGLSNIKPVKEKEHYRRLTGAEIEAVYLYLKENNSEIADMVAIGYYTGLRLSDVAELEIGEITDDARALSIIPNKTRLRKLHPLYIPLLPQTSAIVKSRITRKIEDGYLFGKCARNRPSRKIAKAFRACGILNVGIARASFHSLRATFISLMDEAGIPPHITDAITGHAGGGMHARYTQPSHQALRAAVEKAIPPLCQR